MNVPATIKLFVPMEQRTDGNFVVDVMSSSPPDSDAIKPRFGNADARPLPTHTFSTSISPRTYLIVSSSSNIDLTTPNADTGRPTADEGEEQQRTGSGDVLNRSGVVRLKSMSATKVVIYTCC